MQPIAPQEAKTRTAPVSIRRADVSDVMILAYHRAAMFRDMGQLDEAIAARLEQEAATHFRSAVPAGTYLAWVATPEDTPSEIVAGAGVQLRPLLPRPDETGKRVLAGQEGLIVNVYTERAWRRRGIAELLMQYVLDWAREAPVARLVLHASAQARPLYEKLGFVATNEMRLNNW